MWCTFPSAEPPPTEASNACASGGCLLFAGPGLGIMGGYPSWADVLPDIARVGGGREYLAPTNRTILTTRDGGTNPAGKFCAGPTQIADAPAPQHGRSKLEDRPLTA